MEGILVRKVREVVVRVRACSTGLVLGTGPVTAAGEEKPALLGGTPARKGPFAEAVRKIRKHAPDLA
ncbi:MAG: hypothetical protein IMZ44_05860 [Planctomycetes bacterium]|nr:hypothetical protein [Planctomycetota bacterium]